METRANHFLVGSFVLAILAGLVVFVVWLTGAQLDQKHAYYKILFSGSVTGLKVGNPVRYRGVPVGSVTRIRIDPDNVEQIEVAIEVPQNTPIKTDTEASLEMQGITGVAYIQLSGGTHDSPLLKPTGKKNMATIRSKPSGLTQIIEGAPELINRFIGLVGRASDLLSEDNQTAIAETLANFNRISGAVAGRSDEIESMIVDADATVAELRGTMTALRQLTESINDRVDEVAGDVDETMHVARGTAKSLTALSNELTAMVEENRAPIRDFTSVGLYELSLLVNELRTLTGSLTRLTDKVENDPARFFFGNDFGQGVDLR